MYFGEIFSKSATLLGNCKPAEIEIAHRLGLQPWLQRVLCTGATSTAQRIFSATFSGIWIEQGWSYNCWQRHIFATNTKQSLFTEEQRARRLYRSHIENGISYHRTKHGQLRHCSNSLPAVFRGIHTSLNSETLWRALLRSIATSSPRGRRSK